MTQTEALKLALEGITKVPTLTHGVLVKLSDVESAIKEALAQPEQWGASAITHPEYVVEQKRKTEELRSMLAQPEQEPVAKVCHDLDGHIGWNPKLTQLPDEGTLLYTSTQLAQQRPVCPFDAAHDALEKAAGIHISQQTEQQQEPVAWYDAEKDCAYTLADCEGRAQDDGAGPGDRAGAAFMVSGRNQRNRDRTLPREALRGGVCCSATVILAALMPKSQLSL